MGARMAVTAIGGGIGGGCKDALTLRHGDISPPILTTDGVGINEGAFTVSHAANDLGGDDDREVLVAVKPGNRHV